jgi:predicted nucleotidyltransferase
VARGEDRADSDVDLLAELPQGMSLFAWRDCRRNWKPFSAPGVDLVPSADPKPDVRSRRP